MFMNDVNKKEEIRNIAIKHLRKYGIKYRGKTPRQSVQVMKLKKLFHIPLQNLENETVTLKNGQQLVIPKRLNEICSYILSRAETEGIFRKEGSKSRQNEIKLSLDRGCMLGTEHHVIDVAVVLKCFLRELPEPLVPYSFHEVFVRCSLIEKKVDAILLACLLLPTEHLYVLSYLMQFLSEIASQAKYNKMNSYNLSVLLGPNIFPINEKVAPKNKLMVKKTCDIIKLMIDNSKNIGLIPDYIIEQIGRLKSGELDAADKVKRRRSGSLTRIFNGLKKMVGNRGDEDIVSVNTVTPDLLLTPSITYNKKGHVDSKLDKAKTKEEGTVNKRNILERRWSAITSASNLRRKKRESFIYHADNDSGHLNYSKAEYVRVSKSEYEEIKSRVTAIEKRLSLELESVQSTVVHEDVNIVHDIQSAYEHTLVQTETLNPGSDQLVRRLSRELRIRNSDEKLIRSPSARKIGNIRRRSRELEKPNKLHHSSSLQQLGTDLKPKPVNRTVSSASPLKSNASHIRNLTHRPSNFNINTCISFDSPNNTFQFSTNMDCYDSSGYNSGSLQRTNNSYIIDDKISPRNRGIRVKERRVVRRNGNVSPLKRNLKQRHCKVEGHNFIEITGDPEYNKENGMENIDIFSPTNVPHIKKPIPVMRTPKRLGTPKSGRNNTPLRVLPTAKLNIADF